MYDCLDGSRQGRLNVVMSIIKKQFYNLFQNVLNTAQCTLCVPACALHCETCETAGKCTTCSDGFVVKGDKSGCDGPFVFLSTWVSSCFLECFLMLCAMLINWVCVVMCVVCW